MRDLKELDPYRLKDAELEIYGLRFGSCSGVFSIRACGHSFLCVASSGGGWEHVSVSPKNRNRRVLPTWEEMCAIKDTFWGPEECVVQYHPPKSEYVNNYPYCLHLWRPIGQELPRPPKEFV